MPHWRRVILSILLGVLTSWIVAWGAAIVRPCDGGINVFGTGCDQWKEGYLLPQHRLKTPWGDVLIDVVATGVSTSVSTAAMWARRQLGDPPAEQLQTYPYLENVDSRILAQYAGVTTFDLPAWTEPWDGGTTDHVTETSAFGWPFRCLAGVRRQQLLYNGPNVRMKIWWTTSGYLVLSQNGASRLRLLPARPIYPGLLANTTVFSVAWLGLLFGVSSLKRLLRSRRGLCTRCGYSRSGLAAQTPCPECGTD